MAERKTISIALLQRALEHHALQREDPVDDDLFEIGRASCRERVFLRV